jgi:hypothetical protein
MLLMLAGSLAFVAIGTQMTRDDPVMAYAGIVFFGLCALVAALNLHPRGSYLELGREGFVFASMFRRVFVPWGHVREFVPYKVQHTKMVGWNYVPSFTGSRGGRKLSVALAGVEAALPDTYGMKAEELASLLNQLLVEHARA